MIYDITDINSLPAVAKDLIQKYGNHNIWAFKGEMGMGKTTLIKQICSTVGVKNHLSSPTFSIVNEYSSDIGTIYHFDFYRIQDTNEVLDMGLYEYIDNSALCLMEWSEKIEELLQNETKITIHIYFKNNQRLLECSLN